MKEKKNIPYIYKKHQIDVLPSNEPTKINTIFASHSRTKFTKNHINIH